MELEYIGEVGNEGGPAVGMFARGHHDRAAFADEVNSYWGRKPGDKKFITPERVQQCWCRFTPSGVIAWPNKPGRGAIAVTTADF